MCVVLIDTALSRLYKSLKEIASKANLSYAEKDSFLNSHLNLINLLG